MMTTDFAPMLEMLQTMRKLQAMAKDLAEVRETTQAINRLGEAARIASTELQQLVQGFQGVNFGVSTSPPPSKWQDERGKPSESETGAAESETSRQANEPRNLAEMSFQMMDSFKIFNGLRETIEKLSKDFEHFYARSDAVKAFTHSLGYAVVGVYSFAKISEILKFTAFGLGKLGKMFSGPFGAGGGRSFGRRGQVSQTTISFDKIPKTGRFRRLFTPFHALRNLLPTLGGELLNLFALGKTGGGGMFSGLMTGMKAVFSFVPKLITKFLAIGRVISAFMLTNPFGLIITGITAAIYGIYQLWTNWSAISEWIQTLWTKVCEFFKTGIDNLINGPFSALKGLARTFGFFDDEDEAEEGPQDQSKNTVKKGIRALRRRHPIVETSRAIAGAAGVGIAVTGAGPLPVSAEGNAPAYEQQSSEELLAMSASSSVPVQYQEMIGNNDRQPYVYRIGDFKPHNVFNISVASGGQADLEAIRKQVQEGIAASHQEIFRAFDERERRKARKSYSDPILF